MQSVASLLDVWCGILSGCLQCSTPAATYFWVGFWKISKIQVFVELKL
jgi:hypothetical protein